MDGSQSWKLALETSANFVATRARNSCEFPALDSSASFRQVCHEHKALRYGTHSQGIR